MILSLWRNRSALAFNRKRGDQVRQVSVGPPWQSVTRPVSFTSSSLSLATRQPHLCSRAFASSRGFRRAGRLAHRTAKIKFRMRLTLMMNLCSWRAAVSTAPKVHRCIALTFTIRRRAFSSLNTFHRWSRGYWSKNICTEISTNALQGAHNVCRLSF
jgi:hypothetical protein